jgi:hypothetical protein
MLSSRPRPFPPVCSNGRLSAESWQTPYRSGDGRPVDCDRTTPRPVVFGSNERPARATNDVRLALMRPIRRRSNHDRPRWALITEAGGDQLVPADVYVEGRRTQLPRWQPWAREVKRKLEELLVAAAWQRGRALLQFAWVRLQSIGVARHFRNPIVPRPPGGTYLEPHACVVQRASGTLAAWSRRGVVPLWSRPALVFFEAVSSSKWM